MKIKCLRIHYEENMEDCEYQIFDRYGNFLMRTDQPIKIENLPKVKYFGFCPLDTIDVTLEFEDYIDSSQIIPNPSDF